MRRRIAQLRPEIEFIVPAVFGMARTTSPLAISSPALPAPSTSAVNAGQ